MNYQQWRNLNSIPLGRRVAINTGGYIMLGVADVRETPGDKLPALVIRGPYGREYTEISTWSWSETEPAAETLMVKPHGIFAAHWWNEIGHLLNILDVYDVRFMVEIGILDGGLASLMFDRARWNLSFHYLGVDLPAQLDANTDARVIAANRPRYQLHGADAHDPLCVKEIVAMTLSVSGTRFFYCDGGDKAREAALFWPYLRPGDLLGLHDYSDDPAAIGPEVFPENIKDIIMGGRRLGRDDLAETRICLIQKI